MTASGVRPHGVSRSQRRRLTADGPLAGSFRWGRAYAKAPRASSEELKTYARKAGLDMDSSERCLTSATHQAAVQKGRGRREDPPGVAGTPTFSDQRPAALGRQSAESFARLIEEELAGGTPRARPRPHRR